MRRANFKIKIMNEAEKLLEKHFTKLGCKCDVMDNTKQYQASLNAINEALTLYGVVLQSEQFSLSDIHKIAQGYTEDKFIEMVKHLQG